MDDHRALADYGAMSVREQVAELRRDIRDLETILRVHENRWQRIIGVMLVLTFLGVGSLMTIVALLWSLFQRVNP
jgi:pheromone shutdown protein TraB